MTEFDDKIFIEDIREGQEVASVFLLNDLRLGKTKNGKPFVGLRLQDRTGHMAGRVWDGAEDFFQSFSSGDVAWVRGVADSFQNQVQLPSTHAGARVEYVGLAVTDTVIASSSGSLREKLVMLKSASKPSPFS